MKCQRTNCRRRARAHHLCPLHYEYAVKTGQFVAGITNPSRAQQHLKFLRESMSLQEITRISGVAWPTLNNIRRGRPILRSTEQRLLAVQPILGERVAPESKVPALGTRRRLQALVAVGYTARDLSQMLGVQPVTVWRYCTRSERVEVYMARAVNQLFSELHMQPGPSLKARNRAVKAGWVSSLAWDDIDDPNETPNVGVETPVSAGERIAELRELGVYDVRDIADRLGIQPASVERAIDRSNAA